MKRTILVIVILYFLTACASAPTYYGTPPKGSKIGVMLLIDENPKHSHVGPTVFQNKAEAAFSKTNFHPKFYAAIEQALAEAGHAAQPISPPGIVAQNRTTFFAPSMGWPILKPEIQDALRMSAAADDLDYVFMIYPIRGPAWATSAVYHEGYGLQTRCVLSTTCGIFALDYVAAQVYDARNDAPLKKMNFRFSKQQKIDSWILTHDGVSSIPVARIDEAGEIAVQTFAVQFETMLRLNEFVTGP